MCLDIYVKISKEKDTINLKENKWWDERREKM